MNTQENFKLSSIENVKAIVTASKAKIDAIATGDADQFFDGERLRQQVLGNLLCMNPNAAKNKFDGAKGSNKYEKLYNVLSGATSVEAQAVNAKLKALAEKMQAKGKTPNEIADLLDTSEDEIKNLLGID